MTARRKGSDTEWLSAARQSLPGTLLLILFVLAILWASPHHSTYHEWHAGLLAVGSIGALRYCWLLTNQLRAFVYLRYRFPVLRARERALAQPYPRRLYVIVPSYREEPEVTRRCVIALAKEVSLLPSRVFLLFSVGSIEEMELIQTLVRRHGRNEHLKITFMQQRHGKRLALGQSLRTVSREFFRVSDWHPDAHNDVVVLMDGDTEIPADGLRKNLGFFRLLPDLGALTTHEEGRMLGQEAENSLHKPWFDLKFAKRHTMMCSHSLSGRVLTLTGRFSIFRAGPVLSAEFIRRVESDHLYHWVFGRFKFLMGDDKSTWFSLLENGWRMMYVPDVRVICLETRAGNFLRVSSSLMFRWNGNMARNNWRALCLGFRRMPLFIWLSLLDQRISMWTSLIGPLVAVFSALAINWTILTIYSVWVILTRLLYLWLLVPRGFVIQPTHLALQIYDQWMGSATKVAAMMLQNRQSWSKANNTKKGEIAGDGASSLRTILAWHRLCLTVFCFLIMVLLLSGILRLPQQLHLLPAAYADDQPITIDARQHGVVPDDGIDDAPALQVLLDRPDIRRIALPAGRLDLDQPLRITRSHLELVGQGQGATRLVARWNNSERKADQAILHVQGQRGPMIASLQAAAPAGSRKLLLGSSSARPLPTAGWLYIEADNSPAFLDSLGARGWRQARPPLRQWLGWAATTPDGQQWGLDSRLLLDLPAGAAVFAVRPLHDISLAGFTIELEIAGAQRAAVDHVYENLYPDHAIDSLRLDWVVDSTVQQVDIRDSGRHALALEHVARIDVRRLRVDGAWNKGKEGNGYVRLARAFFCTLSDLEVANIRHVAFQWSSAGNVLRDSRLAVDVNFHGGFSHHNRVVNTIIAPDPRHPWGAVTRTPADAHWAAPDGPGNEVQLIAPGG